MHLSHNKDGTFSNPVMANGHWSDPCVVRVNEDFYCVTSSIEKCPRDIIRSSPRFQSPNTGTAVIGPDHQWYYVYNYYDALRPALCRQMHVDKIDWDTENWPVVNDSNGPGLIYPKPLDDPQINQWIPDLNDEFNRPELEGITGGALGSKWLFKEENINSWSLAERPGWLRLRTLYPGIETFSPANCLVQRPVSAYFEISTCLDFSSNFERQSAGLLIREFQTLSGLLSAPRTRRHLITIKE